MKLKHLICLSTIGACLGSNYAFAQSNDGHEAIFIGHSFFAPIAAHMDELIESYQEHSGLPDISHSQEFFFQGGFSGCPGNFWNEDGEFSNLGLEVYNAVVDNKPSLFGMTIYEEDSSGNINGQGLGGGGGGSGLISNVAECNVTDYARWIEHVIRHNSSAKIILGLPWPKRPSHQQSDEYAAKYEENLTAFTEIVADLKNTYSENTIMLVPYGKAGVTLHQLCNVDIHYSDRTAIPCNNSMLQHFGIEKLRYEAHNSIFKDQIGHSHTWDNSTRPPSWDDNYLWGGMLQTISALAWMKSIYNVDLIALPPILELKSVEDPHNYTVQAYNTFVKIVADSTISDEQVLPLQ